MPPPPLPSVSLLIFLLLWQPGCRGLTVAPPHLPRFCFPASLSICTVGTTLSPALQMAGKQVCGSTSAGRLGGHARDSNSTPVLKGLPLLLTLLGFVPLLGYSYTTLSQLVPYYSPFCQRSLCAHKTPVRFTSRLCLLSLHLTPSPRSALATTNFLRLPSRS